MKFSRTLDPDLALAHRLEAGEEFFQVIRPGDAVSLGGGYE